MFREDFPLCEDYELWLRLSAKHNAGFVPQPLILKKAGHPGQLSKSRPAMDYWRVRALLPFLQSPFITKEERRMVKEALIKKTRHSSQRGEEASKHPAPEGDPLCFANDSEFFSRKARRRRLFKFSRRCREMNCLSFRP